MKKLISLVILCLIVGNVLSQVHTSYLWHMQQPIYWPAKSKANPNQYQFVKESHDLKISGDAWNVYSDGQSHPLNNLEEIFSKADRVKAYQHGPKNSVQSLLGLSDAGAQVNYSGCLIENVNSLANANMWGYYPGWEDNFTEAKGWTTSGGQPRMDMIGFTFHHALSPLISERALAKEIQAHKYISTATFGGPYSKGYWPAECSFSERIIKVLVQEGLEWTVVANSHLARTLNDYDDDNYGTSGVNIDPPNAADKVPTNGVNWWGGQIDGRGGAFAAPYCYQAHKAKYVDPESGQEFVIDVVPMGDLLSYQNGFSSMGTGDIDANIAPYSDANHPSIVLLAHDGDNAWGGGDSYYQESVPNFANEAAGKGYTPTTIQQFLNSNPVPANDIVRVEDGSWVNAANDWGHPQFINWLWPLYSTSDYRFNPDGWTEDARNWAVITAAENYVLMAEDLSGSVDISKVISPGSNATNAEKAWHFFLPSLTSGYMYYGKSLDMEVKQTIAGNNAIIHAQNEINNHPGVDNTAPSVFIPQRFPYNPGGKGFGPIYAYQEVQNSSDFHVWTFAYDVSGIQSAVLKYRTDDDGTNPLTDNVNEVYANGTGVGSWSSMDMARKAFPKTNVANDPEIDFFELPTAIAELCYAEIRGLSEVLVDYYVEVTDSKGNVFKTPIQHVYVGEYNSTDVVSLEVEPASGNYPSAIDVSMSATTTASGATINIYYTTDGIDPDNTDNLYSGSFEVGADGEPVTIKAIAYDSDGNTSPIVSRSYSFGTIDGFEVHFKNTSNWSNVYIYLFDKNANAPLAGWTWPGTPMSQEGTSPWYNYMINESVEVGIVIHNNAGQKTVDLFRTTDGWYDFSNTTWYNTCPGDCPGVDPVPVLSVNPAGGTYSNTVTVTLSATNGGDIYYTTNGDAPDDGSTSYTGDLTFTATTNLKAIAYNATGSSNVIDETYTITTTSTYDVHFKNTSNWNDVYIYLYNKATGGQLAGWNWPGQPMSQEQTSKWYVYTIDESVEVGIVFNNNNNGQQTGDLFRTYNGWYDYSNSTWYDECPGDCPGETPTGITIHYNNNSTNWSNVTLYYWNTSPVSISTSWPGVQMTDPDSDGWYSYTLPGVECTNVIFSNNGNSQTGDLNICGDGYYDGGWVSAPSGLKSAKISDEHFSVNQKITLNPFPNPFESKISFSISEKSDIKLVIMNMQGSIVHEKELKNQYGTVEVDIDVPKGIYIMQLLLNNNDIKTYKMVKNK